MMDIAALSLSFQKSNNSKVNLARIGGCFWRKLGFKGLNGSYHGQIRTISGFPKNLESQDSTLAFIGAVSGKREPQWIKNLCSTKTPHANWYLQTVLGDYLSTFSGDQIKKREKSRCQEA